MSDELKDDMILTEEPIRLPASDPKLPARHIRELIFGFNSHYFVEIFVKRSEGSEEGADPETAKAAEEAALTKAAQLNAILEAAFLVAAADGELSDEEYATLSQTIAQLSEGALQEDDINASLTSFADLLDQQSYAQRLAYIADTLPGEALRQVAFIAAVGIAHSDKKTLEVENTVIQEMAQAFGFSDEKTKELLTRIEASLSQSQPQEPPKTE